MSVLILWIALFAVYQEVGTHEVIGFDDALYVTENGVVRGGLSWASVKWAFTNVEVANWHPVTWLSHLLDQTVMPQAHGLQILEGVVWHGMNAVLVYKLLMRVGMGRGMAWAMALVFVCHPLNVESVAWLSQRKNQLGLCFTLLAVLRYLREREAPTRWGAWWVCFWYALSLMSKAMAVMLPVLLWGYEMWQAWASAGGSDWRRHPWRQWGQAGVKRVAPFLLIAVVISAVTFWAQRHMGAVETLATLSVQARLLNAAASLGIYLRTFIAPGELTFFYPLKGVADYRGAAIGCIALAGASAGVMWVRRGRPLVVWGWVWFLLTLVPVIGIVQVGMQSHADRYMYMPMIGLLMMVGGLLPDVVRVTGLPHPGRWAVGLVLVFAVAMGWRSHDYLSCWRNAEVAYANSIKVGGKSYTMLGNLAAIYMFQGRLDQAEPLANELRLAAPRNINVLNLCMNVYAWQHRWDEAYAAAELMTQVDPLSPFGWVGLATINKMWGRRDATQHAVKQLGKSLEEMDMSKLQPNHRSDLVGSLTALEKFLAQPDDPRTAKPE